MTTGVKEKTFSVQKEAVEALVNLTTQGAKQPAPISSSCALSKRPE